MQYTQAQLDAIHTLDRNLQIITGASPKLIEVHNLDDGGVNRQLVDGRLIERTMTEIRQAGAQLRANHLPRLRSWCDTCEGCDFAGICRRR